mmetsp:Transcript_594/g.1319  ORF Transcript_594/g.1319 Transcript_594/m.1319 type:complete len:145 (-) Transcript_594:316-750(-)
MPRFEGAGGEVSVGSPKVGLLWRRSVPTGFPEAVGLVCRQPLTAPPCGLLAVSLLTTLRGPTEDGSAGKAMDGLLWRRSPTGLVQILGLTCRHPLIAPLGGLLAVSLFALRGPTGEAGSVGRLKDGLLLRRSVPTGFTQAVGLA